MPGDRISKHLRVRRAGFTLLELVTAMAITTVLVLGMGSVMVIAANAIPDGTSAAEVACESRLVLDRMTEDLQFAKGFSERTDHAVTFTVADRGHGATGDEKIRYAWSGTPGDPLTLEYNDAAAVAVIDDVRTLKFDYLVDLSESGDVPLVEGSEVVLFSQDSSNLTGHYFYAMSADSIESTYFVPSLPNDAASWSITRAAFAGQASGGTKSSSMSVEVRSAVEGGIPNLHPASGVIDQVAIPEASLTGTWQQVSFSNAVGLDPTQGCHIAFRAIGSAMNLQVASSASPIPGTLSFEWTSSGGWTSLSRSTWLWVWGKVTAPDPNGSSSTTSLLTAIGIQLQVGADPAGAVRTEVRVLNEPDAGA